MAEEIFRIEIPIEAVDKTDKAALQQLEATLSRIFTALNQGKATASGTFNAISQGAQSAASALEQSAQAAEKVSDSYDGIGDAASDAFSGQNQAAATAQSASEGLSNAVAALATEYSQTGQAAQQAGQRSSSAFDSAANGTDKFTQRIEKSNQTLRQMFREKLQLTLAALDKASPVIKSVLTGVKGLTGKAWNIALKVKDFITAPFRKIRSLLASPIAITMSLTGMGISASDMLTTYNEFETGMSAVKSLAGATDEEFQQLKQTAKDLGASTAFSASEAAEGMQYLAMAGWDTSEIIAAMPGLLDLAAAGATELGTAADIVSDVMTAMGMEASEASRAADVFAKTATSTNTTVEGLGETMKYAAPIAHTFGMSLEEVSALAGMMANAGIKGSQAGTSLRSSLLQMSKPTTEMQTMMDRLGISFTDASGNMKKAADIVSMLEQAFSGLTDSEKLEAAQVLFGEAASSAWLGILDQGADAYNELAESLYNASGAADEMATTRLDNLSGDIEELGGALETAKLEIVDIINPYLREGVQWLTTKIPVIQEKVEALIESGIEKAKQLKDFLMGIFSGDDFQNANGIAEKLFVAWDKVIAEPFTDWWQSGGSETLLGAVSKLGKNMGEVLSGIIAGILAALKGEEIDFSGMNITGMAQAAAELAKEFAAAFIDALNVGGLFGSAPGWMQTGVIGYGAFKVGSGAVSAVKTINTLKTAFGGVSTAAAQAAPAVATVGTNAAVTAVSAAKVTTVLGALKTALSAIPVWGWIAAAAITAVCAGYAVYSNAQKEHEQQLRSAGDEVQAAATEYETGARRAAEAMSTISGIHELKLKLSDDSVSESDLSLYKTTVSEIDGIKAEIEVLMSESSLSKEKIKEYTDELAEIYTRQAEIELKVAGASLTPEQVTEYKSALDGVTSRKAEIEAKLAEGGDALSQEEIAALSEEYNSLSTKEAALKLMLEGSELSKDDLAELSADYAALEDKRANIMLALNEEGGMTEDKLESLSELMAQLADKEIVLDFQFKEGSLSTDDLSDYNEQLQTLYDKLIQLSGGQITQEDVDAGRVTDETLEQVQETLALKEQTGLTNLEAELVEKRQMIPEIETRRAEAQQQYETDQSVQGNLYTARSNLIALREAQQNLLAQENLQWQKVGSGEITNDDYYKWYDETFTPGMAELQQRYTTDVVPYAVDRYGIPLISADTPSAYEMQTDGTYFDSAVSALQSAETAAANNAAASNADYGTYNDQLKGIYGGEVSLLTGKTFSGTEQMGMSLEEIAASYSQLDAAGQQLFADALAALDQLNAQTDYVAQEDKTQSADLIEIAAKADLLKQVQEQVQAAAESYAAMTAEEQSTYAASETGKSTLESVNTALEALGTDKISSLDELNAALETLTGIDLTTFTLESVQTAFTALGGDATQCKAIVDSLKASLEALKSAMNDLDGTTATTTVVNNTVNKTSTYFYKGGGSNDTIAAYKNAEGGIYNGAILSWVAEDGAEAIIPLSAERRARGIDLWLQAGRALGVAEYAEGGILAPYSGSMEGFTDGEYDSGSASIGTGSGSAVAVNVSANPVFQIEGGSSEDIIAQLKGKQRELAEMLGGAIADRLEDVLGNMT